jgi:xanthine dehydrogenase accessory factor
LKKNCVVLIKGAGDVATGVAHTLIKNGYQFVMTEIQNPTTERRAVAFSEAVYEDEWEVEGLKAKKTSPDKIFDVISEKKIPIVVDPETKILKKLNPDILIDAIMAKRNTSTNLHDAPITIGLGPGFEAGKDVNAAIETCEGPNLGKVYYKGSPQPFHGIPCKIEGKTHERVIKAPQNGTLKVLASIGEHVNEGQIVAKVDNFEVKSEINGVLRGIMRDGLKVKKNTKLGDIDPRDKKEFCFSIAQRSEIIGEGVLEAIKILRAISN